MNDEGVCRTAPATPGLVNSIPSILLWDRYPTQNFELPLKFLFSVFSFIFYCLLKFFDAASHLALIVIQFKGTGRQYYCCKKKHWHHDAKSSFNVTVIVIISVVFKRIFLRLSVAVICHGRIHHESLTTSVHLTFTEKIYFLLAFLAPLPSFSPASSSNNIS